KPPEFRDILPGVLGVPRGDAAFHAKALVAFVSTHAMCPSFVGLFLRATAATPGGSRTRLAECARSGVRPRCIPLPVASGGIRIRSQKAREAPAPSPPEAPV